MVFLSFLSAVNSNLSVVGDIYNGETSEIAFESGYHIHEIGSIILPKGKYIICFGGYNPISNKGTQWANHLKINSPSAEIIESYVALGVEVYVFSGTAIVSHDRETRYAFLLYSWESEAFTTTKNWSIKAVRIK